MSEHLQSVRKTKHSKLKESPEADPRTHVEPTNRYPLTADRWYGCLKPNACLFQRLKPITCRFRGSKPIIYRFQRSKTHYMSISETQIPSHVGFRGSNPLQVSFGGPKSITCCSEAQNPLHVGFLGPKAKTCWFQRLKPITSRFQRLKTHYMSVSEAENLSYVSIRGSKPITCLFQRLKTQNMLVSEAEDLSYVGVL